MNSEVLSFIFGTATAAVVEMEIEAVPVVKEVEEDFLFRLCFEFKFKVFIQSLDITVMVLDTQLCIISTDGTNILF